MRRTRTVTAVTMCELKSLSNRDVVNTFQDFPHILEHFVQACLLACMHACIVFRSF